MKTLNFTTEEEWLEARKGKITGSRLKDIIVKRGNGQKQGFYELIAERVAVEPDDENAMDRGHRLEVEAIERFAKETGKEVDTSLVMWTRDDNDSIAISPDGFIGTTEAVEAKCLSSAKHIEAWYTNELPNEYYEQAVQYFVVNDELQTLYFVFYNPRIPAKDYFTITVTRDEVAEVVQKYLEAERDILEKVRAITNELTF